MKAKKVIALILVAVSVLACTACSTTNMNVHLDLTPESIAQLLGNIAAANGGSSNAGGSSNTGSSNTQTQTPTPTEPATQGGSSSTETTTQSGSSSTETTTQGGSSSTGTLSTKAEIVKFYCDAYNKLSTAKSITRTYDYTSNYNNILDIAGGNSTLAGIANTLMGMFMVENTEALAVDVNSLPPVGVSSLNINPNVIGNATCVDKGSYYEITLYSTGTAENREVDSQPGTGSAGSFGPLLKSEDVSGAAAGYIEFEGLHSYYETATVAAKITKDGKITDLEFKTPCILHFDKVSALKIIKVGVCEIGLLFNQKYTVTY